MAATKPKAVNESLATYGDTVRVERGPEPGAIEKLGQSPNTEVAHGWYVYELQDEDPTDTQEGVWKEVGFYRTEEGAHSAASKLA